MIMLLNLVTFKMLPTLVLDLTDMIHFTEKSSTLGVPVFDMKSIDQPWQTKTTWVQVCSSASPCSNIRLICTIL